MPTHLPQVTRLYQNHELDNTRWDHFTPRDDDIIITTSYKSGATWMQQIMKCLILPDADHASPSLWDFSPWLDNRHSPIEERIGHGSN